MGGHSLVLWPRGCTRKGAGRQGSAAGAG
jgi:hypothetical protein